MNILQKLEAKQLGKLLNDKVVPDFHPGDTVKVSVKIKEGDRERLQAYEGVCISRAGAGLNETFTVRKISFGEGVERVFPLWSNRIASIELIRSGSVRRAKLYYLRDLRGKSARITERTTGHGMDDGSEMQDQQQDNAVEKEAKPETEAKKKAKAKAAKAKKTAE